jgi:hypothetical protein
MGTDNNKKNDKKKLTITSENGTFEVMLNPGDFSKEKSIEYSNKLNPENEKFFRYKNSCLTIPKIVLDTTGVIPVNEWPLNGSIKQMIEALEKVVYKMDGQAHEPSTVEVQWGSTLFKGKLKSIDSKYVLFDNSGDPLRAEISLSFLDYKTVKELEAEAKKCSPDLTHVIEVKAGDTLPNLCNKVYKDPSFYMQVARINGLSNFRYLKPGLRLVFPPLVD